MRQSFLAVTSACALLFFLSSESKATITCSDRGCFGSASTYTAQKQVRNGRHAPAKNARAAVAGARAGGRASVSSRGLVRRTTAADTSQVVDHPAGCPRTAFCGCGAAVRIFGAPIRSLWLAANWFRFPAAAPAPGMAAVRPHHVFVIEQVLGNGLALAYDANSGGHRTRVHVVSLRGYRIVNPRG